MGYTNVRDYSGGKQDWMVAGLPVERGEEAQAQEGAEGNGSSEKQLDED